MPDPKTLDPQVQVPDPPTGDPVPPTPPVPDDSGEVDGAPLPTPDDDDVEPDNPGR